MEFFDVSLDALLDVAWETRGRDVLRLHDRFESMTEEVCADQSVNRDWCEPFTFRLGRFYYLLEYKLDVLVDDLALKAHLRILSGSRWSVSRGWIYCSAGYLARVETV